MVHINKLAIKRDHVHNTIHVYAIFSSLYELMKYECDHIHIHWIYNATTILMQYFQPYSITQPHFHPQHYWTHIYSPLRTLTQVLSLAAKKRN